MHTSETTRASAPSSEASDSAGVVTDSHQQLLRRLRLHPFTLVLTITLAGLGLRLYKLGYRSYWDDEVISTLAARASLAQIYTSISDYSIHPPLYYMILSLWSTIGDDLFSLRLLSVLISTACVPLVYLLGRTLQIPQPASVLAAALFAVSPFHVFHSQHARMYPLLVLSIIITTLLFCYAWRHNDWRTWLGLALAIGLGFHVHIYFPLSLIGLGVWALGDSILQHRFDRSRWSRLIIAHMIGVALFLPFAPQLLGTTGAVVTSFWTKSIPPHYAVLAVISLSNFATGIHLNPPEWLRILGALAAGVLLIQVLIASAKALYHNAAERSTWLLLHCMIWTPVLLATVISLTIKPIIADRYLAGVTPFLFILIMWAGYQQWHQRLFQATTLLFSVSIVATLTLVYPAAPVHSPLIDTAVYLNEQQQPGDAIAYTDWQSFDAIAMLYPQQADVFLIPGTDVWTGADEWQQRMQFLNWHEPDNVAAMREFAPRYERVWLVLTIYSYDLPYYQEHSRAWLEENGTLVEQKKYARGIIFLYQLDASVAAQ